MAAAECEDVEDFLTSMGQCFEDVDNALRDKSASVSLDYLESRLEGHFQIANAIVFAIRDNASDELKQLVSNLLTFSQGLLQEIHTTTIQREGSTVRSAAWIPSKEASSGGRPRYRITKEQIETLRETGMNSKRIALSLGISESTLYRRRQELGLHESFVDISYEELYTVITGMLNQTLCW